MPKSIFSAILKLEHAFREHTFRQTIRMVEQVVNEKLSYQTRHKGAGTFHSVSQCKEGSVGFGTSDFHETFTKSSLALNMTRKLLLDPYLAIHGKIMST